MAETGNSRREFLKAGTAAVAAVAAASVASGETKPADTAKILNYHPEDGLSPSGEDRIHDLRDRSGRTWRPQREDRVAVLERAVELGMNYVDNNIDGECDLYGAAMAKSKSGRTRQVVHRLRLLAGEDHRPSTRSNSRPKG